MMINMAFLLSLICFNAGMAESASFKGNGNRIFRGLPVEPNSKPFMVEIQIDNGLHQCGGAILDETTVLTAAHCTELKWVVAGQHSVAIKEETEQVRSVSKRVEHPLFSKNLTFLTDFDLAILKLDSPLTFNKNVQPIGLPSNSDVIYETSANVYGWGRTETCKGSELLLEATLNLVSDEECTAFWSNVNPKSMLCAHRNSSDTCRGDSGGPLVCREEISKKSVVCGIVSWGRKTCGTQPQPAVFAEVKVALDWIRSNMGTDI